MVLPCNCLSIFPTATSLRIKPHAFRGDPSKAETAMHVTAEGGVGEYYVSLNNKGDSQGGMGRELLTQRKLDFRGFGCLALWTCADIRSRSRNEDRLC